MFLKHPRNTFIVDFECIPSADGPLPLQVAVFDASEQQIVPATVIDHGMTIGELRNKISLSKFHQARGMFSPVAMIQKFYPGRYQDRTTACRCKCNIEPSALPLPGKIDSHFSSADTGAKGWKLDAEKLLELLEEATSGIDSSEVVDDDENSQSNIDELLNEDEKVLGDIPGDESVEELSIKLEEENLFEHHLGQNAEFLAIFSGQNHNFLGEDDTDLFVADAPAMNTIEGSTSGDNKGLGEPTTPATDITKGKRVARITGATKTNNPNAGYNPGKKDHNSNNNGESIDE
ncbi:Fc.00g003030.m01.CDS01 [Cosmosporella sp. VM-42]